MALTCGWSPSCNICACWAVSPRPPLLRCIWVYHRRCTPPSSFPELASWMTAVPAIIVAYVASALGVRFNFPGGGILLPMVVGIIIKFFLPISLRSLCPVLALSYSIIGWGIGFRFSTETLQHAARAFPRVLGLGDPADLHLCGCWRHSYGRNRDRPAHRPVWLQVRRSLTPSRSLPRPPMSMCHLYWQCKPAVIWWLPLPAPVLQDPCQPEAIWPDDPAQLGSPIRHFWICSGAKGLQQAVIGFCYRRGIDTAF